MKEVKKIVPLKDVCLDFIVPQRDKPTAFDGNIPWCRIEDIEGRYLNGSKSCQNVTKELADKMNMHLCPKGTVISACSASIGNQAITTIDCYTNQTFIGLVVNPNLLYNVYLYYFLESQTNNLLKLGQGATIKYISKDKYKRMLIPLPSLSKQQSIVDYLDSAFAQIDELKSNAERQLAEARALFQSALKEMLEPKEGWEIMKLGEFAYMKAGNFVKASEIFPDYKEGLYPCYGGNGFRGYVKEPNQNGDYCMIGRQGALCGCINRAQGIFRTTEHAVIVKPYKDIPTSLVYYMLVSLNLNKYATGAAQPGLSVNNIAEAVIISVPPYDEQQHIADTLDSLKSKVDRLQENFNKMSQECDALKQAILRQIFE